MRIVCLLFFVFITTSQFSFGQVGVNEISGSDIELSVDELDESGDDLSKLCLDQDDSEEVPFLLFDSKVDYFGDARHSHLQEDYLSTYFSDHFTPPDLV